MNNFRISGNAKFRVNIRVAYTNCYFVSLQEPQENNLRNPEINSEPCQTSRLEFCKNSQQLKAIKFFRKKFHLKCFTEFEYTSIICYSLFGKTEDANKIEYKFTYFKFQT